MSQSDLFCLKQTAEELIEATLSKASHMELSTKRLRQRVVSKNITKISYYDALAAMINKGTVILTDDGYQLIPEKERNGIPQDSNSMETRS